MTDSVGHVVRLQGSGILANPPKAVSASASGRNFPKYSGLVLRAWS